MWFLDFFFLNSANLICLGTDISKYCWESLWIRENETVFGTASGDQGETSLV